MSHPKPVLLLPILFATLAILGSPARASYAMQSAGQVVVHADKLITTSRDVWLDVPGMKGAVTLPTGGDLAVSLTLEGDVTGGTRPILYVRAIVDNQVLSPSVTKFFVRATGIRTSTTNFFARGLTPGTHKVRFQWSVSTGATAQAWDRTLVMRFARPDSPDLRLVGAEGTSLSRNGGGWLDLPGLTASIDCPWDARLVVNVSGEFLSLVAGKRVFLRAVLDGRTVASPSDQIIAIGDSEGTRAFTFTGPKLARGQHQVQIQWATDDVSMVLFPTLTVTALPDAVNRRTGWLQQVAPSGPRKVNTSSSYVSVPDLGGNVFVPARCDLCVRFSAESAASTNATLYIRVLVDGKPVNADNYQFCVSSDIPCQAREGVFVVRNAERGWHSVQLLWATSPSGTVYLGDRALTVTAVVGQWPLLVTAMESTRPSGYKYGGQFSSSVTEVKNGKRVFRPYVADNFWRANPGVADWFLENSGGHMYVVEAAVIGPNLKKYNEKYYRENIPNPFTEMKIEALQAADAEFDFNYYDRNRDGLVTPDELFCLVVLYQDTTFGEVRSIPQVVTQDNVTIDYGGGVATVYTPDFQKTDELGVIDHELSHLLLKTGDMYESNDPTAPGPYSIMDQHGGNGHLDPLHKLKCGKWYEPYTVTQEGYRTLRPIEQGGNVYRLEDKASHKGEYFLVENRQRFGYDTTLPGDGLAIWHCDESRLWNWRTAVEIEPACGPNYRYQDYLFTGRNPGFNALNDFWDSSTNTNARWHDQALSRIGVWAVRRIDDQGNIRAFFDLPGPGVLAEVEHREMPVDPFGNQLVRIRVVNTGTATDQFKVTVTSAGWTSWTTQYVQLGGYQQRILEVKVIPPETSFTTQVTVAATSTTNSAVTCTDECRLMRTLRTIGTGCPNCVVTLDCHDPAEANKFYEMRASFGSQPGFGVPGVGTVPLHADTLFFATPYLAGVFQKFQNRLDAAGNGRSYVVIPNDSRLKGVTIYCAYITYDTTLRAISNAVKIDIQ